MFPGKSHGLPFAEVAKFSRYLFSQSCGSSVMRNIMEVQFKSFSQRLRPRPKRADVCSDGCWRQIGWAAQVDFVLFHLARPDERGPGRMATLVRQEDPKTQTSCLYSRGEQNACQESHSVKDFTKVTQRETRSCFSAVSQEQDGVWTGEDRSLLSLFSCPGVCDLAPNVASSFLFRG